MGPRKNCLVSVGLGQGARANEERKWVQVCS
jgi:hypothetical protein